MFFSACSKLKHSLSKHCCERIFEESEMRSKNILLKIIFLCLVVGCCATFFPGKVTEPELISNLIGSVLDFVGPTPIGNISKKRDPMIKKNKHNGKKKLRKLLKKYKKSHG
ncbi:uncharacterized protein LOC128858788 isoform X1 [Anastrepha ludens]|uniref:uncharacterized protein LOC128858788 isoform X1 n=1 Tax=Anastrepha ludens TaxID=28586 RepID=UPI0023AF0A60|nr:uncharacterized protein LOC128858788 isoform X1 [Anastrepha ludens]